VNKIAVLSYLFGQENVDLGIVSSDRHEKILGKKTKESNDNASIRN